MLGLTDFQKLSAYTIAKNCSDLTDVNDGIAELQQYFRRTKNPKVTAYIRLHKLVEKREKLLKKTMQNNKLSGLGAKQPTVNIPFDSVQDMAKFFSSKYIAVEDVTRKLANQKRSLNGLGATDAEFKAMLETDKKTFLFIVQYKPYFIEIHNEMNRRWPLTAVGTPGRDALVSARTKYLTDSGYFRFKDIYNRYLARQNDYRSNKVYSLANKIQAWGDSLANKAVSYWNSFADSIGLGALPLLVPVVIVAGAVLSIGIITYFVSRYKTETSIDNKNSITLAAEIAKTNPKLAEKIINKAFDLQESKDTNVFDSIGSGAKYFLIAGGGSIAAYTLYKVGNEIYNNHFKKARRRKKTR